jgi:hypothetical protein
VRKHPFIRATAGLHYPALTFEENAQEQLAIRQDAFAMLVRRLLLICLNHLNA